MSKRKPVTTSRAIHALKPEEKKYTCPVKAPKMARGGMLILVTPKGTKTFYSRLRLSGKQIDIRLGLVHDLSLPEAVEAHNQAVGLADKGIDPRRKIESEKAKREAELTMDQLFERWSSHRKETGTLKERTIKDDRWRWGKYLQKHLGNIYLSDINRNLLASALDDTRKQSKDETRKSLNMLNGCLDYALTRQLIDENPTRLLKPKDFLASPGKPRTRWLSITELHKLWAYLDNGQHKTTIQLITLIKLATLTGARRGELANMEWSELDLKEGIWILPEERSKNGQSHTFYLHPLAVDLLEQMSQLTGHSSYVFQTPNSEEEKPIPADTVTRAVSRISKALIKLEGFESFSLHDLRRTCSSHWVDTIGADSRLVELMLNHLPADKLIRTYQQGKQPEQQKATWLRWGHIVAERVTESSENVAAFKAS